MTKNFIQSVLDDDQISYAYAWLESSHGYGHMNVMICMAAGKDRYRRPEGGIKISCQIGGGDSSSLDDFHKKPYAVRYGFDQRYGSGTLDELEAAIKVMRKIQKGLDLMESMLGEPKDYSEFCQRVLIHSGAKYLIWSEWWNQSGSLTDRAHCKVGAESMSALIAMEREMLKVYG